MAIQVTEILGTDSITGSRIVLNDNFNIIRDEINSIETLIDPDAATLDGMTSVETLELRVGPGGAFNLELTQTTFNINTSVNLTQASSVFTVNGLISHNSFSLLDQSVIVGNPTIDPTTGFANYTIITSTADDFFVLLQDGLPGQEVSFYVEQKGGSGSIVIQGAAGVDFVLDSVPNDKVELSDTGSNVTLKYVLDSINNGAWYVVSQTNSIFTT